MEIYIEDECKLNELVQSRAQYQKVMLIAGENCSQTKIEEIKSIIKESCIFNYTFVDNLNYDEINNGYKLLIFVCSVDELLKIKIIKQDFFNIYFADGGILPFFLDENCCIKSCDDIIILTKKLLDVPAQASLSTNFFYNYLLDYSNENSNVNISIQQDKISFMELFNTLNKLNNFKCIDVEIIKHCKLKYDFLPLVDLTLINAFENLFYKLRNKTLTLVDCYKMFKDETELVDKFYNLLTERSFMDFIELNYLNLSYVLKESKKHLMQTVELCEYSTKDVSDVVIAIKDFAKTENTILSYLYLYDIFS